MYSNLGVKFIISALIGSVVISSIDVSLKANTRGSGDTTEYEDSVVKVCGVDLSGIEDIVNNLVRVYGVDVVRDNGIEGIIDSLYENRIYYGVDYRLKLLHCINYNYVSGTGRDYSTEVDNILTEINKLYTRELNSVVEGGTSEVTTEMSTIIETTSEVTSEVESVSLYNKDSLTDEINNLSGSIDEYDYSGLDRGEFYEIWYENPDGTYYKTTERYEDFETTTDGSVD